MREILNAIFYDRVHSAISISVEVVQ